MALPHVAIQINAANEMVEISSCMWTVHVQDFVDFLFPRLDATWHEPITWSVCFLDGSFAFERINSETVVAKAM
jgi:hypothetical protein